MRTVLFIFLFFTLSCSSLELQGLDQRFQTDPDNKPISMPEENDPSERWDQAYNHFFRQIYRATYLPNLFGSEEAENVNNWDEVPDSSWFTNRIGRDPKSWTLDRISKGPRERDPDRSQLWRIIRGKVDGVTPGFTIKDGRDDMYFIKFDPPGFQELGTSAEVISSLILHAAGYNVPANFALRLPMSHFIVDPKAKTKGKYGKKRKMTQEDFFGVLSNVEIDEYGTSRIVASLALPGRPVGPFMYEGTRSDDPNDDIPHEYRREVRGFHIFSAWLNNTDVRFQNTLDMYVGKKDQGHIKHFFLDFGTSLGAGGNREKNIKVGYEYAVDFAAMGRNFLTLGSERAYWKDVRPTEFESIGTFESKVFDPARWRAQYANRAFELITPRDGFWAAKIIMKFKDDHIRAIVKEANYSNPKAEEYMIQTLIERRDKIGKYWFSKVTPVDEFKFSGSQLHLRDLAVEAGLSSPREYTFADNTHQVTNENGDLSFDVKEISSPLKIKGPGPGVNLHFVCSTNCHVARVERLVE